MISALLDNHLPLIGSLPVRNFKNPQLIFEPFSGSLAMRSRLPFMWRRSATGLSEEGLSFVKREAATTPKYPIAVSPRADAKRSLRSDLPFLPDPTIEHND